MKYLNIIKTNWVHFVGFYITSYISIILFKLLGIDGVNESWMQTILLNFIMVLFLFFTYGLIIILSFFLAITILDLVAFHFTKLKVIEILIIEWLLIISPFIYWAFKYEYWLWICLSISFLCTQYIRKKWLDKSV